MIGALSIETRPWSSPTAWRRRRGRTPSFDSVMPGYEAVMTSTPDDPTEAAISETSDTESNEESTSGTDDLGHDQDSEPTSNAPPERNPTVPDTTG
jgi:hypothetical protein